MKKKIIFVTKALWIGGIETALINLLNHFNYDRYEVTLLIYRAELDVLNQVNPKCRVLIADREKTYTFDTAYKYNKLYHLTEETDNPSKLHQTMMWAIPMVRWLENWLFIKYIRKLMNGEHFDTAIIYSDVAAEIAIRAISADKFLMFYHHGTMRHVYHDALAYKKCEKIIAVSDNQASELKKFVPKVAKKIISIHNLTDVEGIRQKAAIPTKEVFGEKQFNIVSVGRVSHEKGMDIAVQVCARLVRDGYDNIRWWIVGDGPAMQEVRNTLTDTHMEDYVIIVGMQSNPYSYIRQADLYVQPSRFEGYPMTLLEALVLGQPVVSTNNNGAREILEENVTGLLGEPDVENIADKVEMLLNDSILFNSLKKNVAGMDFSVKNQEYVEMLEKFL